MLTAAASLLTACSLFVSVDGLQDDGASSDAGAFDARENDAATADAAPPTDAKSDADVAPVLDAGSADIAFVHVSTGTNGSGSGTIAILPTTAGNTLIVGLDIVGLVGATITDDKGDVFTRVVGPVDDATANLRSSLFSSVGVAAGATKIFTTLDMDAGAYNELYVSEYSGIVAFDVGNTALSQSTAVDALASGAITTTVMKELVFGYAVASTSCVAGTGMTSRSNYNQNVVEDMFAGAPGSYRVTATLAPGARGEILVAGFR